MRLEGRDDVGCGQQAHHVVGSQGVPFRIDQFGIGKGIHRGAQDQVQHHDLGEDRQDRLPGCCPHRWHHDAGHVGDRFDTGQRQDDLGETDPRTPPGGDAVAFADGKLDARVMEAREGADCDDRGEDDRHQGHDQGNTPHAPGAKPVRRSDDGDGAKRAEELEGNPHDLPPHAQIPEGFEAGECGSHRVIGTEHQSTDDCQGATRAPCRGVDAAAIGVFAADDQVADADQDQEDVHEGDVEQRRVTRKIKRQAEDVEPTRAEVAKQHRPAVVPVEFTGPVVADCCHKGMLWSRSGRGVARGARPMPAVDPCPLWNGRKWSSDRGLSSGGLATRAHHRTRTISGAAPKACWGAVAMGCGGA